MTAKHWRQLNILFSVVLLVEVIGIGYFDRSLPVWALTVTAALAAVCNVISALKR